MNIMDIFGKELLFFDGAMGTVLQKRGLPIGEMPEKWNIDNPNEILKIHTEYLEGGANIICANTFGANLLKFERGGKYSLNAIIKEGIGIAKKALTKTKSNKKHFVALDVGPLGKLLRPLGDLDFEEAVSIFAETIALGEKYGADLVLIETMNDLYETKAAVIAAKENSHLPIFVTNAYDINGKLMTGASPEAVCATLEGLGVDAIGINCSFGPKEMLPIVKRLCEVASVGVVVCPNAGLPTFKNGETTYDTDAKSFADIMEEIARCGASALGGCCGTTPEHIGEMVQRLSGFKPKPITDKGLSVIASYTHAVEFGKRPVIIGERINPTGKKVFKEALLRRDMDYILDVGLKQAELGAQVLDVNVGLPEIDEAEMLSKTVCALQAVTDVPLQIDTSDEKAMEKALRLYNGKAMINSVNGKAESMEKVFPLVKKYGGLVVALTLDEDGIPDSYEKRVEIAKKIYAKAKEYGIDKKDIIVDTLAMTISTNEKNALTTLDALSEIHNMGGLTSLGVSNISFGLPSRDFINSTFFTMALTKGLSAAIINPHSAEMMKAYNSFLALSGHDKSCAGYIEFAKTAGEAAMTEQKKADKKDEDVDLKGAIIKGLRDSAYKNAKELLSTFDAIDIIEKEIVPALDVVGKGYEEKTLFLPQLLISAEAAKAAFEAIREKLGGKGATDGKITVIVATVEGDIHDIGKNIVKAMLENYGFSVVDLGKDVKCEKVAEAVKKTKAPLVCLSALMTTTVPGMEKTVELIKKVSPETKVMVGGAVLTEDYANAMGADKYGKDAMAAVRYAEHIAQCS